MAHFPSHARKRALVGSLLLALTAGSVSAAVPYASADDLKDKHGKVRSQIKAAEADLENTSAAAIAAHRQLTAAQARLSTAQKSLASSQARLTQAQALDASLQAQLKTAEAKVVEAKAELARQVAAVAEQRRDIGRAAAANLQRTSPQLVGLATMLEAKDPSALPTGMQAVDNMITRENDLLAKMKSAQAALDRKKESLKSARDVVDTKRQAAAANLAEMARLEEQARAARASIATLVTRRTSAQQVADRAKSADATQLSSLEAEDQRISAMLKQRAIEAKAAAARAAAAKRAGTGSSGGGDEGGGSTSNGSGPLERPVSGYVTSPFGYRVHPIYGYYSLHDGTDFHAPCGTPLKAAGNGKVIEKYFQSAWGNRLLVDLGQVRGHNIVVIYNHLSGYKVGVGDKVSRGETVGYAGTTGWSTGCHLHFTVMVDGTPKNPLDWM